MRRRALALAAIGTLLLVPAPDVAQSVAAARLVAARGALRRAQPDSAEALLRQALDSASGPTTSERVEAWLLIGVARYYAGNDSGVAAAFDEALALDPHLEAPRLGQYDSSLVVLLEAQRRSPSGALARLGMDTIQPQVCVPACPKGINPPRLRSFPGLDVTPEDLDPSQPPREARLVVRFLVDTSGMVSAPSVHVVANNLPIGTFFDHVSDAYQRAIAGSRYDPATAGKRPVPAVMESVLRLRIARGGRVHGLPVGRSF